MSYKLTITLLLFLSVLKSIAQNNSIFNGGSGDGFSTFSYLQNPILSNNSIFNGGIADGFSASTFLQAPFTLNNAIFNGGASDGFSIVVLGSIDNEVPLPVQLTFFRGELTNGLVKLHWRTASEVDNEYFYIEKMTDGKFETIGGLQGRGTINFPTDYYFIDPSEGVKKLYYRLRQVDFDGVSNYSEVIKVEFEVYAISLYPNPSFTGEFYISTPYDFEEQLLLKIVNHLGSVVKEMVLTKTKNSGKVSVPVMLEQGFYTVIIHAGQTRIRQSLLVNKN